MNPLIWKQLKYKNISVIITVILLVILIIASSCSDNSNNNDKTAVSTVAKAEAVEKDDSKFQGDSVYQEINTADYLTKGNLILVNSDHEVSYKDEEPTDLTSLYDYINGDSNTQIFSMVTSDISVKKTFARQLSNMLKAFNKSSKVSTVMIKSGYVTSAEQKELYASDPDSYDKDGASENQTGLAVDFGTSEEGYPAFTPTGNYQWIGDNAYKYGIILRYPSAKSAKMGGKSSDSLFRYVGAPHAEIMKNENQCLEEYLDFIKGFSYDKPYMMTAVNGNKYGVYYVKADGEKTNIEIPLDDNDKQYDHSISGNNMDGFVITVNLGKSDAAIETTTAATTASSDANSSSDTSSTTATDDSSEPAETTTTAATQPLTITTISTTTVTPYVSG